MAEEIIMDGEASSPPSYPSPQTPVVNSPNPTNLVFTADQWKAIAAVVGNAALPDNRLNGKFDNNMWIVNTGATHHVTGNVSWLTDASIIYVFLVGLPNGSNGEADWNGN